MVKPVIIHIIAAARPNFMKIAPLYHALGKTDWCEPKIIHTGQHYDANMSDDFFRDLGLPAPHYHLGIGSGSHAEQTGNVMIAYEKICQKERPDWLIVVGDVNPTAACSMVGAKLGFNVAHLEAGLRSGDRSMPEEVNRLVTDVLANVLWTPSPDADENLAREGIPKDRITRVGNIMMDSYELLRERIDAENAPSKYGLAPGKYAVVTFHRPSNVDQKDTLSLIVEQLMAAAGHIPLIFPVHPRTRARLEEFQLWQDISTAKNIQLIDPVSYIPFMSLVSNAALIITDSGGIQEETTYLDIPCLTLRPNTERPITISEGTNQLIKPEALLDSVREILNGNRRHGNKPDLWDGMTARRIVEDLQRRNLAL